MSTHTTTIDRIDPIDSMIREATSQRDMHLKSLRSRIATAQDRLDRAAQDLDNGYGINDLGILQSAGPEVDREAALYMAAARTLTEAEAIKDFHAKRAAKDAS